MTMGILVLSAPLPSAPFVAALRAAAPDVPVWSERERPPSDEAVEAILAWRLKPGTVSRYPKLRVLCSTGAGVDKLLAASDLPPDLPVTRVVDPLQAQSVAQYVVAYTLRFARDLLDPAGLSTCNVGTATAVFAGGAQSRRRRRVTAAACAVRCAHLHAAADAGHPRAARPRPDVAAAARLIPNQRRSRRTFGGRRLAGSARRRSSRRGGARRIRARAAAA
ncbi:exported hypothetical protein [Burkholderiales bacterium]|nr:exported hypothetical protein [Burkholderiales bacterium]